jgi:hypothetical protein
MQCSRITQFVKTTYYGPADHPICREVKINT